MKTIKINCPNCNEQMELTISEDFELQSIKINEIELSQEDQIEILRQHGVELG